MPPVHNLQPHKTEQDSYCVFFMFLRVPLPIALSPMQSHTTPPPVPLSHSPPTPSSQTASSIAIARPTCSIHHTCQPPMPTPTPSPVREGWSGRSVGILEPLPVCEGGGGGEGGEEGGKEEGEG
ncbi:hypothetical protein E2C01_077470 [Portunus trituberculatus]|uniref:Uncharacterized protein n=1 Tax=Portunus trituberculatus TaxID=210409 RepID=A0A5B7IPT4_PORTR|nr:hypothetical protein [Portunus trituberculatus]